MSFTVSYGAITLTTELWYEIEKDTSSDAPRLYVIVTNWVKNYLKAFDANTGKNKFTSHGQILPKIIFIKLDFLL